jgi:hypothetical protein
MLLNLCNATSVVIREWIMIICFRFGVGPREVEKSAHCSYLIAHRKEKTVSFGTLKLNNQPNKEILVDLKSAIQCQEGHIQ